MKALNKHVGRLYFLLLFFLDYKVTHRERSHFDHLFFTPFLLFSHICPSLLTAIGRLLNAVSGLWGKI